MSKKEISVNSRKKILELESAMINIADGVNVEGNGKSIVRDGKISPIKHAFADGVYIRQMDMVKDTVVVGAIHKHLHMCFLLKGHLMVANEEEIIEHIAPCFVIAKPGIKRVLYSKEDSVWYNTHKNPSNTEDVEQLEKELVAVSYEEYEKYINKKK